MGMSRFGILLYVFVLFLRCFGGSEFGDFEGAGGFFNVLARQLALFIMLRPRHLEYFVASVFFALLLPKMPDGIRALSLESCDFELTSGVFSVQALQLSVSIDGRLRHRMYSGSSGTVVLLLCVMLAGQLVPNSETCDFQRVNLYLIFLRTGSCCQRLFIGERPA